MKTRWKTWSRKNPILGKRLFHEEFGFFKITKIQSCHEYCANVESLDGTHWFQVDRAFIKTDNGLKYIVPYLWLYLGSVYENGESLKR